MIDAAVFDFTLKRNFEKKCVEFSNLFKEVGSNNFPNENYNNIKNNAYLWMGKHLARHQ